MPLLLLLPVLLMLDTERERLMPRLPQMPRPPQRLMLDTMVILPQLSRLPQSVSQSQSRRAPRLLTAQLLLVMTPRLDPLRLLLMLLLPLLLLLLLQLLLDMVDMDWLDMAAGNQTLVPLYHINIIVLNK